VDRQQIFFSYEYYGVFLSLVRRFHVREELQILAYCLMPNHFHLLVRQLRELAISHFMEQVCGEYAKTVNQLRGRVGHLFQRRYGMKWVWSESGILPLVNYIHQNPVKGGLVTLPEEWDHSSCKEYFGLRSVGFLDLEHVLSELADHEDYRSFLARSGDTEILLPFQLRFRE